MKASELKELIRDIPDECEITFGVLEFNRIKARDAKSFDVELLPVVHRNSAGEWIVEKDTARPGR